MEKASFVYKKANDLHVGINLTKTKRKVLHFYYETKLLSCPVVSVEMSDFQPLNLIPIKTRANLLYYTLDYFISFYSVLHFTVVSRRIFSLVGRLSGNDDGKRQRQRQKRPESHIRFSLAKQKLCTCITGHFFWYISLPSLHSRLISRLFEDVITRQQLSFSLCELIYSPVLCNSTPERNYQHLTN